MIRKDKITTMIQKAKQQADCIIFVAHWGTEDETMPNAVSYTHLDVYKRQPIISTFSPPSGLTFKVA